MAKAVINLQKESGGIVKISPVDGTGVTEVTVPESGNLVSVGTAVTDNAIARFDSTTGKLQNSGVVIDDNGNVGIGTSSPSSSLTIKDGLTLISQFGNATPRPAITSGVQKYGVHAGTSNFDDGFLRLSAGGGTGASTKSYIDISGYSSVSDMNMNIVFGTGGVEKARIDASGNLLLTSGTGALGYGTGAGGTVTQLTSKSTAVTLNKPCGQIIMHNAALASGAKVVFTLNNALITNKDLIHVTIGDHLRYSVEAGSNKANSEIILRNVSGSSYSDSVVINFALIKGAIA